MGDKTWSKARSMNRREGWVPGLDKRRLREVLVNAYCVLLQLFRCKVLIKFKVHFHFSGVVDYVIFL